jgi:hypothetical protein
MIKDMKIGTKVKAVKDIYYVSKDTFYEDYYTQEEIMNCVSKMITVGDVYVCKEEDWKCIEGSMLGEYSDGYFEMSSMIEKGVFVVVE